MEFPTSRVVAGEAAILHELVHVYFPNGNRMLAEGLAVHLQAQIGRNPAFPSFEKKDLSRLIRCELKPGIADRYWELQLADLDVIATAQRLTLRVGGQNLSDRWSYIVAGSFVRHLIETHGLQRFRALYTDTPLVPMQQSPGRPERWNDVYGRTLQQLEGGWKSSVAGTSCES
jgi:hypothetical protein